MANVDAMVQQAVAAIKASRKAEARQILEQALAIDEYNEQAWLWLSGCVDTLEEQLTCLENVLTVNPNSQKAQKGIAAVRARLDSQVGGRAAAQPAAPAPNTSANSPFVEPPPPNPYGDAYEPDPWSSPPPEPPRTATSVEWGPAASPPQTGRHTGQPSEEEYDQWVANLPIASNGTSRSGAPGNAVFTEDIFSVASGPFNAPDAEPNNEPFSFDAASPFDSYNPVETFRPDAGSGNAPPSAFGSFSASLEAPTSAAKPPSTPQAAAPRPAPSEMTNYDDLRFTDEEPDAQADEVETLDSGAFALHAGGWDAANPFAGGRDMVLGSSAGAMPSSGLFKAIPADIQLGGSGEKAGPVLIITTVLLGILNLVALIVLLGNLPR